MLAEHLSQAHDAASRRTEKIDAHVAWIHDHVLGGRGTMVLDLGCGPGLYTSRLAQLGHECAGVDYSPASIAHARKQAEAAGLACEYIEGDLRQVEYGSAYGLAMLISGELNSFAPDDARAILRKAQVALDDGRRLLLEVLSFDAVKAIGIGANTWYAADRGLFSDEPHVCLYERSWDEASGAATTRYFVVDAATGSVSTHAQTQQAYTDGELRALLAAGGFGEVDTFPSLTGAPEASQADFQVIIARKDGAA